MHNEPYQCQAVISKLILNLIKLLNKEITGYLEFHLIFLLAKFSVIRWIQNNVDLRQQQKPWQSFLRDTWSKTRMSKCFLAIPLSNMPDMHSYCNSIDNEQPFKLFVQSKILLKSDFMQPQHLRHAAQVNIRKIAFGQTLLFRVYAW